MVTKVDWGLTDARWEAFLAGCPDATFFHTPGWYRTWADVAGFQPMPALITFDDGTEALLPLAIAPKFRGLVREAHAGLGAAWGGLVAPRILTPMQAEAAYEAVRRRFPDLIVTGNPHSHGPHLPLAGRGDVDETQVVRLLDPEAQRASFSDSRRKSLKQADKVGYSLEVITAPTEDVVPVIYPLYAAHAATWAYTRWRQDEGYFRSLVRHCGPDLAVFVVRHEGELAGFRLLCTRGPIAMALHLARAEAYEKRHVSPWLVARSLEWAHAHGHTHVDFMPSGRLEGVRAYKASFGAEARPYMTSTSQGAIGAALGAVWRMARREAA